MALGAITLARFGWNTSTAYFTSNIGARLPPIVFTEQINQSLLATILGARGGAPVGNPLFDPFFLGAALVLVAGTAWLVRRLGERHSDHGLALLFPCALLVYPAALAHYSVLLVLPLLHLWRGRGEAAGGPSATIFVISATCSLGWVAGGYRTLLSNLLLWCWLAWQARYLIASGGHSEQARDVTGSPRMRPADAR